MHTPSISTVPDVGSSSLFKHLTNVDFPAPLNPIIPNTFPLSTSKDTSSMALKEEKYLGLLG